MFLSIFNNFFPIINKSQTPLLLLEDQGKLRRDNTVSKSYNTLAGFLYIFKYPPPPVFFDYWVIYTSVVWLARKWAPAEETGAT